MPSRHRVYSSLLRSHIELLNSFLKSSGFDSWVIHDPAGTGQAEIWVRPEDYDEIKELIDNLESRAHEGRLSLSTDDGKEGALSFGAAEGALTLEDAESCTACGSAWEAEALQCVACGAPLGSPAHP